MATEPGKIFLPNYIILYFFRIQNLEGGADRVDKKGVQACRGRGPGVPGTTWYPQILADPLTLSQSRGANYAPTLIVPHPPRFSKLPKSLGSMMSCEIMLRFENATEIFAVKNKRLVLLARQQRQRLLLPIVCCVKESNP